MAITVKILTRAAGRSSLYATRDLDVLPISIGRDESCTIALDDPHKHISRFHVEIEEQDGVYWMSVVSKVNPVMVKGRRYGPATRLTLSSGDTFEIGEYEVQVLLPAAGTARPTTPVAAAESPRDPRSTTQTLIENEDTAEKLFNESTFFGGDDPSAAPAAPPQRRMIPRDDDAPEETFVPQKASPPAAQPAPPPAAPARPASTAPSGAALRAFLEGAGLPHKELSAAESERLLRDSGAILRAAVEGLMLLLLARAEMRKEFEAEDRTMVAARDNNPLKLMSDPHEAMEFLFDPAERTDGFLDPVQAIGDACEGLRSHELALMAGMRAAIVGALRRFDPPALERAFEKSPQGFSLASRKSKLWDLFVEQQEKLAHDAQEDFNKVFGRDFMSAYQTQLRRLKGGR